MSGLPIANEVVMQVQGVSKRFSHTPERARRPGTKEVLFAMLGRQQGNHPQQLREDEFWAVRNVSFELHRGEALGIVGLNGAGKSTLLKMMLGRLGPDEGTIRVHGKAGGLIELGAGFHHELSGRRNIYLNASMLGVTEEEVDRQIEDIIDFADIGRFIDSPVKTYSSGMRMRLGFAVTVHFVPDVVVCDEVLAVGDFEFRQKCLQRIKEIRRTRSVVLVSHSTADIALFCNRAMLMHHGECLLIDTPEQVLRAYSVCTTHISADEVRRRVEKTLRTSSKQSTSSRSDPVTSRNGNLVSRLPVSPAPSPSVASEHNRRYASAAGSAGHRSIVFDDRAHQHATEPADLESDTKLFGPTYWNKAAISGVSLQWSFQRNESGYYLISGEPLHLQIAFKLRLPIEQFRIGFPIFSEAGQMILGPDSRDSFDAQAISQPGEYCIHMLLDPLPLNGGRFRAAISICDDPAQVFRRLLPYFSIVNSRHEFGVAKCFSTWTLQSSSVLRTGERS